MQEDCCFFIGHRDSPPEIYPQIVQSIETLIHKHQVLHFVVGGYGAFDRMVAKALIEQKKKIPGIILSYLTPYHPTNNSAKKPEGFDEIYYPDGMESVPARYAIVKANQKMIRQSKYLVIYAHYAGSNSKKILEYALCRAKKGLINIFLIK